MNEQLVAGSSTDSCAECSQFQRERNGWMESAAQFCRNMEYYRGLLDRIGQAIGPEAYTADDGSINEDVLRAKVPEIVERRLGNKPVGNEAGTKATLTSKSRADCSPCPFCNEPPRVTQARNAPDWWIVDCLSKTCEVVPTLERKGRQAAIDAWNKRPPSETFPQSFHEGMRQSYLKALELSGASGMLGDGDKSDLLEMYRRLWPRAPSDIRENALKANEGLQVGSPECAIKGCSQPQAEGDGALCVAHRTLHTALNGRASQ